MCLCLEEIIMLKVSIMFFLRNVTETRKWNWLCRKLSRGVLLISLIKNCKWAKKLLFPTWNKYSVLARLGQGGDLGGIYWFVDWLYKADLISPVLAFIILFLQVHFCWAKRVSWMHSKHFPSLTKSMLTFSSLQTVLPSSLGKHVKPACITQGVELWHLGKCWFFGVHLEVVLWWVT